SIGCVAEDGSTFYAELEDYDRSQLNDWLRDNVICGLVMADKEHNYTESDEHWSTVSVRGTREFVSEHLRDWLHRLGSIEVWSDCLAYDWVLFCDLFGDALSLPPNVYYIPFDL